MTDERDTTPIIDIPQPPPDLPDEVHDGDAGDGEPDVPAPVEGEPE